LEGVIPDATANQIIQKIILPEFKAGKMSEGINAGADAIVAILQGEAADTVLPASSSDSSSGRWNFLGEFFPLFIFIPIWLMSILARSKSWWAGGVVGGIIAIIIGFVTTIFVTGLIAFVLLVPLGLLFDYLVSKTYAKHKGAGTTPPWWIGGGGFGSGRGGSSGGSHFGGFGGGFSGGGGSSGRW
jgi:uncharacterized protein